MQLVPITEMLHSAQEGGYGVGSFSARNTFLIDAVLRAAQAQRSPVIVQISANEFGWFDVTAKEFAERFYAVHKNYEGQAVLHLDHTKDPAVIKDAIDAGFMSVMIDASQKGFEENAAITKEVVEYAHARGVAVEAELGRIGATDKIETDNDESLYTDPQEAKAFVERTGVDTLAVSIGTAHGVYPVKNPMIDLERLAQIREQIDIPLVLHGGSGLPRETVWKAITVAGGGVSKINIATDLEQVFLGSLGCGRKTNKEIWQMDRAALDRAADAVQAVVEEKIADFVRSADRV